MLCHSVDWTRSLTAALTSCYLSLCSASSCPKSRKRSYMYSKKGYNCDSFYQQQAHTHVSICISKPSLLSCITRLLLKFCLFIFVHLQIKLRILWISIGISKNLGSGSGILGAVRQDVPRMFLQYVTAANKIHWKVPLNFHKPYVQKFNSPMNCIS